MNKYNELLDVVRRLEGRITDLEERINQQVAKTGALVEHLGLKSRYYWLPPMSRPQHEYIFYKEEFDTESEE